jgi:molecular chaperone GrpE
VIDRAAAGFWDGDKNHRGVEDFFRGLVPVLDDFDALRQAVMETGAPEWRRGIDFFEEKLFDLFSSFGLEAAAEIGDPFDPVRHRAVGADERAEGPEGVIARIIRGGWIYRGRLLRAADVIVAKKNTREEK